MIPITIAGTQPSQGFNYTNIFDPSSSLQNISSNINPNKRRLSNNDEDGYEENRVTKTRKLKIYSLENKLDIIDYAKVIGNRAAGREFNVAESSIREWRKNESKIKDNYKKELLKNSESNELLKAREILSQQLDTQLIDFINAKNGKVTWYDIKYKAEELECQYKCVTQVDITKTPINMGWVSRFMKRVTTKIPHVPPPSNSNHNLVHNNQNISNNNNSNIQNGNVSHDINNSNPILPSSILQFLNIQQQHHHQQQQQQQQRITTSNNNSNNLQNSQHQQPFILDQNVIATLIHQFNLQKQQQQQQNCILNALLASQQNPNKLSINYSQPSIFTLNNNTTTTPVTTSNSSTTPTPTITTSSNNNNNNSNGIGNQINSLHLQSLLQVENLNILQLINNLTNGKINNFPYIGVSSSTNDNSSSSTSSSTPTTTTTTPSIINNNNNNNNIITSSTPSPFDNTNIKYPLNSNNTNTINQNNTNNNNNNNNILKNFLSQGTNINDIQRMILNANIMISTTTNDNNNISNTKKSTLHNSRRKGHSPKKTSSTSNSLITTKFGIKKNDKISNTNKEHDEMIKQSDTEDSLGGCDSSSKTSDIDSIGSENRKMEVDVMDNNNIENGNSSSNNNNS